jgi:shikimate kinase
VVGGVGIGRLQQAEDWPLMKPIIFIGPIGAGKSTMAKMVAEELSVPSFSLDKEEHLAAAVGFDVERYKELWKTKGLLEAYAYRRSFYDRLVALFLASHDHGVLDLGGGHPIVPDQAKQEVIKKALAPYEHIFLLMPTPDPDESIRILRKRNQLADGQPDLNALYFQNGNRVFWEIAKFAVYTEGKTAEQTHLEVMRLLSS